MPSASYLQCFRDAASPYESASTSGSTAAELQLDLQTPSSALRQHLDPEALPRPDYFESLDELHLWYQMRYGEAEDDHLEPCSKHAGPSALVPTSTSSSSKRTKLVVCHDFKGGYNESPYERGYSLEHLHLVDTFIYFSHKRVSVPSVSWLTAASRTGTKVLGTLIFEWAESVPDLSRLLRGPERKAMPLRGEPSFSPQYAIELIELALERNFSGYLVNIEVNLDLGFSCSGEPWPAWIGEQARVGEMHKNAERLRAWVHFLREEGTKRFIAAGKEADEWEVMWYDSVVYPYGQLAWQDGLTEHNIDFFQSAHTFFTNYTWARPPQPLPPGQLIDPDDENPQILQLRGYGLTGPDDGGWHPQLLMTAAMADSIARQRSDIYVGIDVFGRNCWGGLKSWKSLDMIGPHRSPSSDEQEALGLSVALFAPGWTWEDEDAGLTLDPARKQQKRSWSHWWHIDQAFWVGNPPQITPANHRISIAENDVKPVQKYFHRSNLERSRLRRRASPEGFYTNFSFGSGNKWHDDGRLVHDYRSTSSTAAEAGFTDMGACMPKPDLLYAAHNDWKQNSHSTLRGVKSLTWEFDQGRAWSGTTSLIVACSTELGSKEVTIPLCSAVVKLSNVKAEEWTEWSYTLVVSSDSLPGSDAIAPHVEFIPNTEKAAGVELEHGEIERRDRGHGWTSISQVLRLRHKGGEEADSIALSLGFTRHVNDAGVQTCIGALQLSRKPTPPSTIQSAGKLEVCPVANMPETSTAKSTATNLQAAVLTWTAPLRSSLTPFHNVFVQVVDTPETRVWLGTSTREATAFEFCIPADLTLPVDLRGRKLEYVITSLDVHREAAIARGPALLA